MAIARAERSSGDRVSRPKREAFSSAETWKYAYAPIALRSVPFFTHDQRYVAVETPASGRERRKCTLFVPARVAYSGSALWSWISEVRRSLTRSARFSESLRFFPRRQAISATS